MTQVNVPTAIEARARQWGYSTPVEDWTWSTCARFAAEHDMAVAMVKALDGFREALVEPEIPEELRKVPFAKWPEEYSGLRTEFLAHIGVTVVAVDLANAMSRLGPEQVLDAVIEKHGPVEDLDPLDPLEHDEM